MTEDQHYWRNNLDYLSSLAAQSRFERGIQYGRLAWRTRRTF
ncbi:MAG: hypothetical protein ACR5K4_01225 [Sodalis sp. (in: enterobacteria)]